MPNLQKTRMCTLNKMGKWSNYLILVLKEKVVNTLMMKKSLEYKIHLKNKKIILDNQLFYTLA
jgi:hypothetical protein